MVTASQEPSMSTKLEIASGNLLIELQEIWDEVGETDDTRESMLLEIERECLDVYRRKVDHAYQCRAQLRQEIADSEAELAKIYSTMGIHPMHIVQKATNLKEELNAIVSCLDDMRKMKREREKQFLEVLDQINNILSELCQSSGEALHMERVDPKDLSLKSLEVLHIRLDALQKEKSDRLKKIMDHLNILRSLCLVLGVDFKDKIREIHPTLDDNKGTKCIDNDTIQKLSATVESLKDVKIQRLCKLQDLAGRLLELWNLMDTPPQEQHRFHNVTSKIAASELEIVEPNCLSIDTIGFVEDEVLRLELLKSSKMKELILRRRSELEEICRKSHMIIDVWSAAQYSVEAIESGAINPGYLLDQIDLQISDAKEQAFSRKEILESVEKWMAACEEETWLEEFNRDDNRYNAGRGAHLMLKRAEKARAMVNKLPSMVEILAERARLWENERGTDFLYDGVQLLSMLEQYNILRQEKELERQRMRDQKKLQGQLLAEQEVRFGSKVSPAKSIKKAPRYSIGGSMMQKPKPEKCNLHSHPINKITRGPQSNLLNNQQGTLPKKQGKASNTRDLGQPSTRKPFSPVSTSSASPKINNKNSQDQRNITSNSQTPPQMTPCSTTCTRTPTRTPPKPKSADLGHVDTIPVKMHSPLPTTPLSFFGHMQTITTPSTPCSADKAVPGIGEFVEYSFEELRAGFVVHK